jgi:hypothetical protein
MRARLLTAVAASGLMALGTASTAGAAVTIGQVGANTTSCTGNFDWAQPNVSSGRTYVVPGTGTITSWSTFADQAVMLTMKIYRRVADPDTYQVVGHAGPQTLTPGGVNTFPASVPVKPGDILGQHVITTGTHCAFSDAAEMGTRARSGDLADGAPGQPFGPVPNLRVNMEASFEPDNTFALGGITRNKKKGTATLTINNLPNPGELTAFGKGVNAASVATISKAVTPGTATLLIRAKGKKKRKLNDTGKVKLNPTITYTPTGGTATTQSRKVKLKKKL